jgi:hypothetical protein
MIGFAANPMISSATMQPNCISPRWTFNYTHLTTVLLVYFTKFSELLLLFSKNK